MTDTTGTCPHCSAYIGIAWRTHAALCLEINAPPTAAAVVQHDPDKAAKGACQCSLCVEDRAS